MPALTHSAINVAVYNDKDNAKAINSGGLNLHHLHKQMTVVANCFNSGISKDSLTPPIKNLKEVK